MNITFDLRDHQEREQVRILLDTMDNVITGRLEKMEMPEAAPPAPVAPSNVTPLPSPAPAAPQAPVLAPAAPAAAPAPAPAQGLPEDPTALRAILTDLTRSLGPESQRVGEMVHGYGVKKFSDLSVPQLQELVGRVRALQS